MADKITAQAQTKPVQFFNMPDEAPTLYVGAWEPTVSDNDVKIKIGDLVKAYDLDSIARLNATLAFTHQGFIAFADALGQMALFLKHLYPNGELPRLVINSDVIAAFQRQMTEKAD